jgi:hypothetical protein
MGRLPPRRIPDGNIPAVERPEVKSIPTVLLKVEKPRQAGVRRLGNCALDIEPKD